MNKASCALATAWIAAALNSGFGQPTITSQPVDQTASLFASARFAVAATGVPPLSYQWTFNNSNITGATGSSLTLTNIQRSDGGAYSAVVSDTNGSVTSRTAYLRIVPFQAIYCFGFSWTATRDSICGWGPPDYYSHQACNGPMWPEFISTNLGLAYSAANNLAYCGADSAQVVSQVNELISNGMEAESVYFLWPAGSDFLYAASTEYLQTRTLAYIPWTNDVAWEGLILTALRNTSNAVERLYAKGARSIILQNNFDLSQFPFIIMEFGTNQERSTKLSQRTTEFNAQLTSMVDTINASWPDLRLMLVDIRSGLSDIIANPPAYGCTKAFPSALGDSALSDKSFTGPGEYYVFWDNLHPTSKTQSFIASWTLETLTNSALENLDAIVSSNSLTLRAGKLQIGQDYTLQRSRDLNTWSALETFTAAAGTNLFYNIPMDDNAGYFRLRRE